MNAEKEHFLKKSFVSLLQQIPSDRPPAWGKMSLQQMIEHFTDAVRTASGKLATKKVFTKEEDVPKMQAFLKSDKPFRENTPNPLMPEVPAPVRNASIATAMSELQAEIDYFFDVFGANPKLYTTNPFFGDLDYDMNVQLLHKHAMHHLRQFGVAI
jgi:hypothetical protein